MIGAKEHDHRICVHFAATLLRLGLVHNNYKDNRLTREYIPTPYIKVCNYNQFYWQEYREKHE